MDKMSLLVQPCMNTWKGCWKVMPKLRSNVVHNCRWYDQNILWWFNPSQSISSDQRDFMEWIYYCWCDFESLLKSINCNLVKFSLFISWKGNYFCANLWCQMTWWIQYFDYLMSLIQFFVLLQKPIELCLRNNYNWRIGSCICCRNRDCCYYPLRYHYLYLYSLCRESVWDITRYLMFCFWWYSKVVLTYNLSLLLLLLFILL